MKMGTVKITGIDREISGAIFDLDGTLIDSMQVWVDVDRAFMKERGLPYEEDYFDALKHITLEDAADYTIKRYHLSDDPQTLIDWWMDAATRAYHEQVKLKPYVYEWLSYLHESGVKIGLATACETPLFLPALKRLGILSFFDAYTTLSEVTRSKRFPDIFLLSAKRLGVAPENCVVFDDVIDGLLGAKDAGMAIVGVYDETSVSQRTEIEANANRYIMNFGELLK